jgi:hypothetical protein
LCFYSQDIEYASHSTYNSYRCIPEKIKIKYPKGGTTMRRSSILLITLVVLVLAGVVTFSTHPGLAQDQPPVSSTKVVEGGSTQIKPASIEPSTYTQQVSNVYCYEPDTSQNVCYINVRYAHFGYTSGDTNAVDYVKISIDNKLVAKEMAVFEYDVYYNNPMNPLSFKVACGNAGESSNPDPKVGHVYNVAVEAYKYPNTFDGGYYMSTSCPAYAPTQP